MTTYLSDVIPKIKRATQRLNDLTHLMNNQWILLNSSSSLTVTYIFRSNSELLISENGETRRARWEYLKNQSLIIEDGKTILLKLAILDKNILALKTNALNEYIVFVNEIQFDRGLNTLENVHFYLENNYKSDAETVKAPKVEFSEVARVVIGLILISVTLGLIILGLYKFLSY